MKELLEIFPWHENFATGILQIDEQHQRLVHLLNKLASGLAFQADTRDLNNIFNELADYAVYHFQTEENVWHQYLAGDMWEEAHRKSHESFVSDVLKLKDQENSKPFSEVLEDVLSFLTHWLIFHILDSDKRMSKVVLAVQSGMSLEQAKQHADQENSGAAEDLIETVLSMNDTLTTRTLQLMKEVKERQQTEAKHRLATNVMENTLESMYMTEREREVMMLVIAGHTSKEIAQRLGISYRTVEVHRLHVMQKTGASNLMELARIAKT
jgi:hemerythrin-like metal-binding protein